MSEIEKSLNLLLEMLELEGTRNPVNFGFVILYMRKQDQKALVLGHIASWW